MNPETRQAIHKLLDACIDKSEAGFPVWLEFSPALGLVKWWDSYCSHAGFHNFLDEDFVFKTSEDIKKISEL